MELTRDVLDKLKHQADINAIEKYVTGGSLGLEDAYDYMCNSDGLCPDNEKVMLWNPLEGFCSDVIVSYINSEERMLFRQYVEAIEIAVNHERIS